MGLENLAKFLSAGDWARADVLLAPDDAGATRNFARVALRQGHWDAAGPPGQR